MRVLFLAFDGVLNSSQSIEYFYRKWVEDGKPQDKAYLDGEDDTWCPIAISNLKLLIELIPDLVIVITSSWREDMNLWVLRSLFHKHPLISKAIIDKTPIVKEGSRAKEIKSWISQNPHFPISNYIILDSLSIGGLRKHLIKLNPKEGFMYSDFLKALNLLGYTYPDNDEDLKNVSTSREKIILASRFIS